MRMTSMEKRRIEVAAQDFEDDMDMDELDFHMSMVLEAMEDHLKELQSMACKSTRGQKGRQMIQRNRGEGAYHPTIGLR